MVLKKTYLECRELFSIKTKNFKKKYSMRELPDMTGIG